MIGLLLFGYLLALGLWIGIVACFSFIVAPAVFGVLGSVQAGDVVSAIFPRYYLVGAACAAVACGGAIVLGRLEPMGRWRWIALVLAVGLAATVWAGAVVHPRAQDGRAAMRASGPTSEAAATFRRLHRRAVLLNAASLATALAGLGLTAAALRR